MSTSSLDPTAFPEVTEQQFAAAATIADLVHFGQDEELIAQGSKDFPFFIIKSGEIRIVEKRGSQEHLIITHGPGHFTGDIDMLTGRSAVISAVANGPVEAYRMCAPRLRRLLNECPDFSDMLLNAFQTRRQLLEATDFVGVRMIGDPHAAETTRMQEFFYKNHVPHTFYDAGTPDGQSQLQELQAENESLPVVHCNGKTVGNPSLPRLSECIGISRDVDQQLFDLVIVGSGPAGLAAAVYAASEGIKTLVIDSVGPGGQAGSSSKIENFMGFPSGLSGSELAHRGYLQALKFGAKFIAPITVQSLSKNDAGEHLVHLCTGQTARARSVLIASGVRYRQLGLANCQPLEGAGVFYAATSVEARACANANAVVVGGGNSAGQAAMFLAESADAVKILIRGDDLNKSMSNYLANRIFKHPKIDVLTHTEVAQIHGERFVEAVEVQNNQTGYTDRIPCAGLFTFIGAQPNTSCLPPDVALDNKGFVLTGSAIENKSMPHDGQPIWTLDRAPCDLETTVPGIMAAGDVRSGTTKRCGFAVGEGSLAVACIHRYLSDLI